ncbi:rhodanese-like domain-containing protein [Micromonospora tulbaghiae]
MNSRPPATADAAEVDAAKAARMVSAGRASLLDVREPDEWTAGHAPRARHLPLGSLRPDTQPPGQPIITVCRSGRRSAAAAARLRAAGLTAYNLTGGMQAWAAAGLPVVTDAGKPGTVA